MFFSAAIFIGSLLIATSLYDASHKLQASPSQAQLDHQADLYARRHITHALLQAVDSPEELRALLDQHRAPPHSPSATASEDRVLFDQLDRWLRAGAPKAQVGELRRSLRQSLARFDESLQQHQNTLIYASAAQAQRIDALQNRSALFAGAFFSLAMVLTGLLLYERHLRERFNRERQRFSSSIASLSEAYALFNEQDRLIKWNTAFTHLLPKRSRQALYGCSYETIHQLIYTQHSRDEAQLENPVPQQHELRDSPIHIYDEQGRHFAVRERRTEDNGTVCLYLDITEMQQAQQHLRHLASHDVLTNLPNRAHFRRQLKRALQQADHNQRKVAVLFFDLDNFKHINDTAGHNSGDLLLKAVAHELRQHFGDAAHLARLGGDEFIAMLPALSNRVPVAELAAHLLDKLREGYLLNESRISVHASVGVALYPEDGEDVNTLIDNADAACLRAKAMGKNGFQFYHPDMNLRSARRRRIEHHLKESLEQARRAANDGHPDSSGLYLEYQPQLCRNGISLLGIEALVRWKHTELGQVSPGEFVPVAEESGLVLALGDWVMQHALRDFSRLGLSPDGPVSLSVNLSRRQFLEPRLVERVTELLRAYGVQPQRLVLEITETEMLADVQKAATVVRQLHRLGIGIAIDDFGAGHSSFEALTHFPIDELKIDQSFVRELHRNPRDRDIVRAMIQVAHAIDATVVAEGVENGEQLYVLGDMRCDRLQGYYLAEPMSFDDLLHFADSRLRISVGGPLVS